ncbi:hypothetical protein H8D99_00970, partial [bacterium]|nr:hypothetical protein [bacterium]
MWAALFTCFGTVVAIVGAILVLVYIVIPIIGHVFTFFGRLARFVYQEMRDILLLPIALFVCVVKLSRALICVVLARWDIVHLEMKAAKWRFLEAWNRTVAIFIDNPLRVFAIETKPKPMPQPRPRYVSASPSNQFLNYTIIGTLPTGGSGAKLYVAQPTNQQKQVVIKCFDITSGSQLPQIIRESRAMESSKKLGLILEHHLEEHRFWYVMPYHAGDHLGVVTNNIHVNNNELNESQLYTILSYQHALLQTLQKYHNAGLWHKDVKPDNIIIHGGTAHLVDLGLVTPLGSAMTLTTHGTEYFRDPELVRQANRGVKIHQVDGSKFDVYGAGAVLYFMLENTFPAQGGLSSFNTQSPEAIRWIVRRAMADYDQRYASIDDMLKDVETVLSASNITGVRPADLPSMGGKQPKEFVRRLPARSTPSTGGGPFPPLKYRTKPIGLLALLTTIVVGVAIVMNNTNDQPKQPAETQQLTVLDFPKPNGRVLIMNDVAVLHDAELQRVSSNVLAQLDVAGWDIFTDADTEARVRRWLPSEISTM